MRLRPYADSPVRLALQVLADVLALVWLVIGVRTGMRVAEEVRGLSGPVTSTAGQAESLADQLRAAGRAADRIPLVGDEVAAPFGEAAQAASRIAAEATTQADRIVTLGQAAGVVVALVAVLLLLLAWLPPRLRWTRQAARLRGLEDAGGSALLAMRALVGLRPGDLRRVGPDPVGAWRAGDPDVEAALARMALAQHGLRPRR